MKEDVYNKIIEVCEMIFEKVPGINTIDELSFTMMNTLIMIMGICGGAKASEKSTPIVHTLAYDNKWHNAKSELPKVEGYYMVAVSYCPIDGFEYAVVRYNKDSDIWNNFKAWKEIDPPDFI